MEKHPFFLWESLGHFWSPSLIPTEEQFAELKLHRGSARRNLEAGEICHGFRPMTRWPHGPLGHSPKMPWG